MEGRCKDKERGSRVGGVNLRGRVSPTHNKFADSLEDRANQPFREDVGLLVFGVDFQDFDVTSFDVRTEEVILDGNVLRARSHTRGGSEDETAIVVFKDARVSANLESGVELH